MSKDIGAAGAASAGSVTPKVEKSEEHGKAEAQAAAHRARQVASLESEIASEQESLKLLDSRATTVKGVIAGLQKKLEALKATSV